VFVCKLLSKRARRPKSALLITCISYRAASGTGATASESSNSVGGLPTILQRSFNAMGMMVAQSGIKKAKRRLHERKLLNMVRLYSMYGGHRRASLRGP